MMDPKYLKDTLEVLLRAKKIGGMPHIGCVCGIDE